jgi:hypothetical protein
MTTKRSQDLKTRLRKKTVSQRHHRHQLRSKGKPIFTNTRKKSPAVTETIISEELRIEFEKWEYFIAKFEKPEGTVTEVTYIPPRCYRGTTLPGKVITGKIDIRDHYSNRNIDPISLLRIKPPTVANRRAPSPINILLEPIDV